MPNGIVSLNRADLTKLFPGDVKAQNAFDYLFRLFNGLSDAVGDASSSTQALQNASVVTLAPNDAFTNERVLAVDPSQLTKTDNGTNITLKVVNTPSTLGGFPIVLVGLAATRVTLPTSGRLLAADAGGVPYANDAAAAAAGVLVGEIYRGSAGAVVWRQV